MAPSQPRVTRLSDYRPPTWLARTVQLFLDLHEDRAEVHSRVRYERAAAVARGASGAGSGSEDGDVLHLDGVGNDLELLSIELDGRELRPDEFVRDEDGLKLWPERDRFELLVVTRIFPHRNSALYGLYRSGSIFCTQMEAQGFRRVTFFQDRPDVLATWTVTLEADRARYPVLLSNGVPVRDVPARDAPALAAGRHRATWHDPFPKPSYLVAAVAGDLGLVEDRFTTRSGPDGRPGRTIPLQIWCDKGNESRVSWAMASLKRAMAWDERAFGREYDLDLFMIVAVNDFNMGAMENKGLNIFNASRVLADAATATDEDFQRVEGVVAHEYFHNWSGNRVTCRDWFQLSLKEGFTVYRDQEFTADLNARAVKRIADVRRLRSEQFPEDAGPMAHPVRPGSYIAIDNFYTRTVYEKGAEVIRMQAALLGPGLFRKGCDLYFARHDGQAVTTDDFV
ncbi:MAG TPA: M1 family aminopeptidase, partial [Planctomycetota bacterium]|nr:M1 family aminopeptidase [Planctomycetota bacterium]